MKVTWVPTPHPHLLLEDIFAEEELPQVMTELHNLDSLLLPPHLSGSASRDGRPLKFNDALLLANLKETSPLEGLLSNHLFEELFLQIPCHWFMHSLRLCNLHSFMVSRYADGQYYNCHFDRCMFTTLVWMYDEPKQFTGGELIFTEYKEVLEPKNNTGVIFFGAQLHEVPPVSGDGRYTITRFSFNQ